MPEPPFAITEKEDVAKVTSQIESLIGDIYQERVGGAEIGDVFNIDLDDILSLQLSTTGGLEKTSNTLAVKVNSTGGLESDADGQAVKIKAASGLKSDADGLQVVVRANYGINMDANGLALIKQAHEADASTAHAVNSWATTNTALNALGTKINNILAKLEALKAFST